ncbi:AbrB/MazE/SpoVT family DNA-binding domain-containing protein [Cardiobacterium hominis]|jgi:putative spoVT/abrB-like|uniref:AbrB/MazE/SpoVT family DNA-binding domain-containing protein n=1 Tax=Cardiobacterium hominis TaxID=2718 RepID=UPI00249056A2|nr:AbrB/MazE/SpoVT family DNA-binding domain-containing protein [Cardiobacterium hominis]
MTSLTIRKSGNAQIISLPKLLLEQIGVGIGDRLDATLQDGKIILEPRKVKELTLEEILEGITPETYQTEEDREWMEMRSVGKELL